MDNINNTQKRNDEGIPHSTLGLVKNMVQPYKGKTFLFFFLTFLGMLAWTASPVMISNIINELTMTHRVDSYIWWMVVLYGVFRLLDEGFWRLGEIVM